MPSKTAPKQQRNRKNVSKLVVPLTKVEGETHLLEELIDSKETPVMKAIGFAQLAPGSFWVSYTITTQGDKVLSIQVSEPDMRQIAEDSAKIAFVTEFMDKGL